MSVVAVRQMSLAAGGPPTGPVPLAGPASGAGRGGAVAGAVEVPPLVYGVDVVELERAQQLLTRFRGGIVSRVAAPAEGRWIGSAAHRLAVVIGIKEAAVKALGGRPEGFTWHTVQSVPGQTTEVPDQIRTVFDAFAEGVGLREIRIVPCRLLTVARQRAGQQLGGGAAVHGAACHGTRDGRVLVAAAFWGDPKP